MKGSGRTKEGRQPPTPNVTGYNRIVLMYLMT